MARRSRVLRQELLFFLFSFWFWFCFSQSTSARYGAYSACEAGYQAATVTSERKPHRIGDWLEFRRGPFSSIPATLRSPSDPSNI
ncbi:hypothetical protein GGR52DRAFT_115297 [Hypoxylon sp. FL1284]|nr:hypothetical protein GGR52DRAFT_115297 [Hypoxylon sp. FL1284]